MLDHDSDSDVGHWLVSAAQAYQRVLNEELAPHGITHRQCQVLGFLALDGSLSQTELANRMAIEPPTLVGILDRMERDGWIVRESCAGDRRKKLISPAPDAKPVWSKIVAAEDNVRRRATRGLSEDEVEVLKQLLSAVRHNLATAVTEEVTKS